MEYERNEGNSRILPIMVRTGGTEEFISLLGSIETGKLLKIEFCNEHDVRIELTTVAFEFDS